MARGAVCDRCGKPTNRVVMKLYLAPKNGRSDHSMYTAHADIGECCASTVVELCKWQKRVKQGGKSPKKKRQQGT